MAMIRGSLKGWHGVCCVSSDSSGGGQPLQRGATVVGPPPFGSINHTVASRCRMKLLLLLSLLSTALHLSSGANLPPTRQLGSYLGPLELAASNRCIVSTITHTEYRTKVAYNAVQRNILITETVPQYQQIATTVTQVLNSITKTKAQQIKTLIKTSAVTNIHTLITVVAPPPETRQIIATATATSTRTLLRQFSTTKQLLKTELETRTEFVNQMSTHIAYRTSIHFNHVTERPIVSTRIVSTILQIPVDRTSPPTESTIYQTRVATSTSVTTIIPAPIVRDTTIVSTTVSVMYEQVKAHKTTTTTLPLVNTQYVTVTRTLVDTVTTISTSELFDSVTVTVRKIYPSTITIPITSSTTVTVQRHVTNEVLFTTTSYARIEHTQRGSHNTVHRIGTAFVTRVDTKTVQFAPPTVTKVATVLKQCNTETVGPESYNYFGPSV